ncbi:MAG: class II aldolase/adducin family protein [Chloroflexi bacterium]|nr:class II aldolase/adducin family protein [Chloroflexota bacterium]
MVTEDIQEIKEKLARALRILVNEGIIENAGHPSQRLADGRICIVGHIHERAGVLGQATPQDFVIVDADGNLLEGDHEPPGEVALHTEVYRARPEIVSVVHTHPTAVIALSIAGQTVLPVWLYATVFAPSVPVFPSGCQINTPDLGRWMVEVMGDRAAVVLKGHGAVTAGTSIEHACTLSLNLEKTARLQLAAAPLLPPGAQPHSLSTADLAGYTNMGADSEESRLRFWAYYGGRLPK